MSNLFDVKKGKLTVHLHPGQTRAWDSEARFTFVIAGTQSGKTSFEPLWLDREIRRGGPGDYIAVTATYDLFKLKFLPEMQHYFCDLFGWQYAASERVIWKNEGAQKYRIVLRSANAPGGLESMTGKAAVLDECGQDDFTLGAWEAIQRRLSLSQGRVFGGTTPYNLGWLKTQIFDKWRAGDQNYKVVQFKSTMNPAFPLAEYERARATLPSWKFEMFYNGEFSRPAGLIYGDFTELHKIDPFPIPNEWPRYLGADFGAVNTCKIWVAQDPVSGMLYLYRELLSGDMTTREHVESVSKTERIQAAWGGSASETQQRMDWRDAGIQVRAPKITDVESGIDRVIEALKLKRLYVFNTLTGTIDQFGTYSRKVDEFGQPTDEIKDKEKYHYLDALRYLMVGLSTETASGGFVMSY